MLVYKSAQNSKNFFSILTYYLLLFSVFIEVGLMFLLKFLLVLLIGPLIHLRNPTSKKILLMTPTTNLNTKTLLGIVTTKCWQISNQKDNGIWLDTKNETSAFHWQWNKTIHRLANKQNFERYDEVIYHLVLSLMM